MCPWTSFRSWSWHKPAATLRSSGYGFYVWKKTTKKTTVVLPEINLLPWTSSQAPLLLAVQWVVRALLCSLGGVTQQHHERNATPYLTTARLNKTVACFVLLAQRKRNNYFRRQNMYEITSRTQISFNSLIANAYKWNMHNIASAAGKLEKFIWALNAPGPDVQQKGLWLDGPCLEMIVSPLNVKLSSATASHLVLWCVLKMASCCTRSADGH